MALVGKTVGNDNGIWHTRVPYKEGMFYIDINVYYICDGLLGTKSHQREGTLFKKHTLLWWQLLSRLATKHDSVRSTGSNCNYSK